MKLRKKICLNKKELTVSKKNNKIFFLFFKSQNIGHSVFCFVDNKEGQKGFFKGKLDKEKNKNPNCISTGHKIG